MTITAEQLSKAANCRIEKAANWLDHLNTAMDESEINTPERQAAFIAQCAHESARLSVLEENLNYSANALLATFPKHFDFIKAATYERHPNLIANRVYADRFGNGDESTGDGWKYRGRGLIQITFKDNYRECGEALGLNLVANPDLLVNVNYAALSAAWFWKRHGLNELADQGDFLSITKRINGGFAGKDDRLALWKGAQAAIC